ncbi:MAG TPA: hypothetical protein VNO84_10765 [Burkholderiaceae bacterium]|nr:hypothetical protein [Burkholderiaceae bacterium]
MADVGGAAVLAVAQLAAAAGAAYGVWKLLRGSPWAWGYALALLAASRPFFRHLGEERYLDAAASLVVGTALWGTIIALALLGWRWARTKLPALASAARVARGEVPSEADREHFAAALAELEGGRQNPGLWAALYAQCDGNEAAARARYVKVRAKELQEAASRTVPPAPPPPAKPPIQVPRVVAMQEPPLAAELRLLGCTVERDGDEGWRVTTREGRVELVESDDDFERLFVELAA